MLIGHLITFKCCKKCVHVGYIPFYITRYQGLINDGQGLMQASVFSV